MGRTPPELAQENGDVTVGLVDKRDQDYVETFRSFSGQGNSLGAGSTSADTSANSSGGTFDPAALPASGPVLQDGAPATSIQVRLVNGQRRVIRINLTCTVADLAALLREDAQGSSFRLVSGFPPKPLADASATVEAAGLKGAQGSMQKV